MTFKSLIRIMFTMATLLLIACPGLDEDTSTSGTVVHFAEAHQDNGSATSALYRRSTFADAVRASVAGGYDYANIEHHEIRDSNGLGLALYRAYVVLDGYELIKCNSISSVANALWQTLVPQAYAHSGHGSEPVGGRALNKPNVIDIVTREAYLLPLGDLAVAPGRYCGVRVTVTRSAGDAYGTPVYAAASADDPTTVPEMPDMAGKSLVLRADYCAESDESGQCLRRTKVDIDDTGLHNAISQEVALDPPLEISAAYPEVFVVVGINYGAWLDGVDVTMLSENQAARQQLLDNVSQSFFIYDQGLGALPPNLETESN